MFKEVAETEDEDDDYRGRASEQVGEKGSAGTEKIGKEKGYVGLHMFTWSKVSLLKHACGCMGLRRVAWGYIGLHRVT